MAIKIPNRVLEAVILSVLQEEPLYGYALTKKIQSEVPISDSTTYPVLRRLEKAGLVTTSSKVFAERVRKYYELTDAGQLHLKEACADWLAFEDQINSLLGEG
ncbi:helix-turn-helix transcriptional regulator [Fructobacillus sp. CRL 2054]|uniref:PadR family transcriptional regulator n=1 Tax=Fructobacillus sp. CRL 2054 TaxID=2763007 RepID=UPI00237A0839|nr:PadR family transcriptional regulator [Fructobacillus sp. CRL 2054]MDD9138418.1 helix-turn-helix transcriptional regulator [Fructobacillus sp. CRL 2054]